MELNEERGFVIYSKSGCINCGHVVKLLDSKFIKHTYILCDDFLIDNRDLFLEKMKEYAGKTVTQFPMVFYDGEYIGGLKETTDFINEFMRQLDFCSVDF